MKLISNEGEKEIKNEEESGNLNFDFKTVSEFFELEDLLRNNGINERLIEECGNHIFESGDIYEYIKTNILDKIKNKTKILKLIEKQKLFLNNFNSNFNERANESKQKELNLNKENNKVHNSHLLKFYIQ
ncbi:hypothetical protein LY90DRAFT_678261 [Neocallimastix californiae]|uniref:Uncharacterized protein n=1 Tax=Neocallimastix californiae TaxID=1754190 RepID=A0A1Y1ZBZ3_9FUNG|nr:hypothetical protein LY90DRAFT_678261 [Neocallimastix californiae]|eukprot:ORY07811.1 hypothetical protein LY90DRAFT_678261 [Neocallimastix californiae]